jgi:cellulose synthase operon protein C
MIGGPLRLVLTVGALLSMGAIGPAAGAPPGPGPGDVQLRRFEKARAELEARRGRPEAVASLAALVSLDEHLPGGQVRPLLAALVAERATDPLVAAQAAYQLALQEARVGDWVAAERRFDQLGLVSEFQVVGPFDAQGRGGLERDFPPEHPEGGPAPGRHFPGKEREVQWRPGSGMRRLGALVLDGLLRPDSDAVAYVLAYVKSPEAQRAVLRIGSSGPVKAWAGGRPILERNVVREPRFDQDAAGLALPAGETALLVKTVVTAGPWRLYLRLTDEAGRPLPGVTVAASGTAVLWPPNDKVPARPTTARAGAQARELGALLRARTGSGARAEPLLDLGRWLALSRAGDREAKEIEAVLGRAAAAAAKDADLAAEALLLLGERAVEEEDRRRALERAAAGTGDPGLRALALAGVGDILRGRQRASAALTAYREALALDPRSLPAVLALASEELGAGLPGTALGRLQSLPAEQRSLLRTRHAQASALEALGRRIEAEAERRQAFERRRTDIDLALELARAARQRGDLDRAIALQTDVVRARPELAFVPGELSRLYEGQGGPAALAAARRVLSEAIARLPDEPTLHEDLGRLEIRAGNTPAGMPHLRQALALRPQNPGLRRYLARLVMDAAEARGQGADDLVRDWVEDGAKLAAAAIRPTAGSPVAAVPGVPPARRGPDERSGSVVLLDKQVVRVHGNGLSERFAQRLVEVRTVEAARQESEFAVRYTPGSQEVEIRKAQVYRRGADGELVVLQATGRDDRELSEPWYGLYYDVRADVVMFEGLRPGDVVEVQYTLADISGENAFGTYFGDLEYIAEAVPRRRWQYVLIGPAGRKFHFNQPGLPGRPAGQGQGVIRRDEKRGGEVVYSFSASDVPRLVPEPGMPGWAEVSPYLHVSTYGSWQDVGRWYWQLIADQLTADDTVKRAAEEAVGEARSVRDKVAAMHRYVLDNTRYVALEFGIHGYKPYRVSQVLSRRFGDCKDKASLLLVLLREVGVEAEMVLLRTRRGGRVAGLPASLAVFDHAIVHVPALGLYLDGTAEFSGLDELPAEDQGATALRVSARGAELVETPTLGAAGNRAARVWQAALAADGSARIQESITVSGQAAAEWRQHYQTAGERQERFTKVWNARHPGATLESVEMDGTDDRNRPVVARSVADVPRLAEPVGDRSLRLPVSARESDMVRTYARLSQRRYDYLISYPWQQEEELRFRLPDGWHVAGLPPSREERSPFGQFHFEVSAPEGSREVVVRSRLEVSRTRIKPGEYLAFRGFLGALDGTLRASVVLEKDEQ